MELSIYQVDAFTSEVFKGNPAAVVPLTEWLPDTVMQNIAIENNLSETAFFIPDGDNFYLRWFTPSYEVDLCGHATLATSWVIMNELFPNKKSVTFKTNVAGDLLVNKKPNGLEMNFPTRVGAIIDVTTIPDFVIKALGGIHPIAAIKARDLVLIYENEDDVKTINPDLNALKGLPEWCCVTAQSKQEGVDFISRFFCADDTIGEDPVTGSTHCTLSPYWAKELGKTKLKAYQASSRGGYLDLELKDDRVHITGEATLYMKGSIYI